MLLLDMQVGVRLVMSPPDRISARDIHMRRPSGEVFIRARSDFAVCALALAFILAVVHDSRGAEGELGGWGGGGGGGNAGVSEAN